MEDLARLQSEVHWDDQLLQPKIAPGSREEELALAAIDAARDDEERELRDEPAARRRRLERHWRTIHPGH